MDHSVREAVRKRAKNACEYCGMPQEATPLIAFHIEHIISRQHGGSGDLNGLALAFDRCNAYKGPNIASIDPETNILIPLFNPRIDFWNDHFALRNGLIVGLNPEGLATARLLNMNALRRVQLRREWV